MNSDSDLQIAGDILEVPHLLQTPREHPATVAEFVGLARSLAADRSGWEHLVRYDASSRWYHRLRAVPRTPGPARAGETPVGYEVWLLSWVPGQGSGPHDHGRSSGVLTVLQGSLTERTERGTRTLTPGTERVFAPGHTHEVVNDALEPAVSLHVYYPGLTEMPMHPAAPHHGTRTEPRTPATRPAPARPPV
ncbi:cysteine dioxygenase [Streptomyces sp. NEAU-W12]|uniref:cysteine dioxygenase n=1 Tax=Streptomyces sp. NEAU-W12 TaxID=2994668 RepID=UPI00224B3D1E|nr:cysteine dioxygenase family protein [Streptomyces sp. NEAU-W12]MCX2928334.1 cysteine dioxygenase family protein [Streptomyces sp. NEAU-W12]